MFWLDLGVSKKTKKLIKPRKPKNQTMKKSIRLIRIFLKKTSSSVQFWFHKDKTSNL
jgi:hypothetical protein